MENYNRIKNEFINKIIDDFFGDGLSELLSSLIAVNNAILEGISYEYLKSFSFFMNILSETVLSDINTEDKMRNFISELDRLYPYESDLIKLSITFETVTFLLDFEIVPKKADKFQILSHHLSNSILSNVYKLYEEKEMKLARQEMAEVSN